MMAQNVTRVSTRCSQFEKEESRSRCPVLYGSPGMNVGRDYPGSFGTKRSASHGPIRVDRGPHVLDLMWSPSAYNVGVMSYSVLRDGLVVAQTAATSHTDSGRGTGVNCRYEVLATDAGCSDSPRSGITVVTEAAVTSAGS